MVRMVFEKRVEWDFDSKNTDFEYGFFVGIIGLLIVGFLNLLLNVVVLCSFYLIIMSIIFFVRRIKRNVYYVKKELEKMDLYSTRQHKNM